MDKKQGDKPNWVDIGTFFIALVALIISVYSVRKSDATEKEVKKASLRPQLHIAKSLEFTDQEDKDWYTSQQLAPHVIHTDFQRSALANYDADSGKGYVFLLLINDGPSDIKSMTISSINWKPSQSAITIPYGIDKEKPLPALRKNHFYALLIDVLEPIDASKAWSNANFDIDNPNYESVDFNVTYEDGLSKENKLGVSLEGPISYPSVVDPPY